MCLQTIYLPQKDVEVPCGRCFECVKRRRNDWYIRCLIESRHRRFTYFGLLTYAEVGQDLLKRDIQLFLKRLRSYGNELSYLIAGEYGDKKKRPHWHCLFFADNPIHFSQIAQAWRGGREESSPNVGGWIRFEPIRSARSIRYTVKYLYKYDGTNSKFELMISKNPAIGKSFLKNKAYYLQARTADFSIDGRKMAMPRYYKRNFFDDYEDIKEHINTGLSNKVREANEKEIQWVKSLYPTKTHREIIELINESKFKINANSK